MSVWYNGHVTLIQATLIYALLALSLQVVLRSGVFSLASVGFFGMGGYAAGILATHGADTAEALLIPLIGGALFGYVLAFPLIRLRGLYLALVTLALTLIINVFATNGGKLTGGAVGLFGVPLLGNTTLIAVIVVVALVTTSQLERRNIGRSFEALRLNEDLARSLGIEVNRQRNFAFSLSCSLGALSGALYVLTFTAINPDTAGFSLVMQGLTMAVLGGVGTWLGALVGSIIVTWMPDMLGRGFGRWQNLVYGVVVMVIAIYAPDGLVGLAKRGGAALKQCLEASGVPRRRQIEPVEDTEPSERPASPPVGAAP